MTTRRDFLGRAVAAAGMSFCGCNLLGARSARAAGQRWPVVINGKRVKTIDVHSHCMFHEANNLLGADAAARLVPNINGQNEIFIAVEQRLKVMDTQAVDMEVLSVNPFWFSTDRDVAVKICDINNQKLAEITHAHPDRFAGFASLTLQDPQLAATQLEDGMKKLGFVGAAIGDRVGDWEFSDPKLDPVWKKAEELGAVLFIHPQGVPELAKRTQGNGWLWNTISNPLGTTIALQHLIFEGTFDKFPGLKVLAAHGGGYLPSYAPRDDHACFVAPAFCDPNIKLKKKPTEYLNQIYYDALVFTPEALRHLVAQVGSSQIMMGTDYPYPWEMHPVDAIMATTSVSLTAREAMLSANARRVLGVKV
jgi:aminocarboxymuconate-semialdehyde decarboxylase